MYFAQLNESNIVTRVIVADQGFVDSQEGMWVQTDIEGVSPKNYAGIGHTYDEDLNGFIAPKPFPSWVLNDSTCLWEAPTAMPDDGHLYKWNESLLSWELID